MNFLGKISNVIKGKKEVVLPMIVQKSVINSYKDSVNGKRSAVNINHIDTKLISKIIVNKVYKECKTAKIIWSE